MWLIDLSSSYSNSVIALSEFSPGTGILTQYQIEGIVFFPDGDELPRIANFGSGNLFDGDQFPGFVISMQFNKGNLLLDGIEQVLRTLIPVG